MCLDIYISILFNEKRHGIKEMEMVWSTPCKVLSSLGLLSSATFAKPAKIIGRLKYRCLQACKGLHVAVLRNQDIKKMVTVICFTAGEKM